MKKPFSNNLETALARVYKKGKGLNIYALIYKLKSKMTLPKDFRFPEEVLLKVCEQYEKDRARIEKPWPWFLKVIKAESAQWHAQQQISRNIKDTGVSKFGDILKQIAEERK